VRERHLDLLPFAARDDVCVGGGDIAKNGARAFMDGAQDLAYWRVRAAALSQVQTSQSNLLAR
jgi:hypothetical protein